MNNPVIDTMVEVAPGSIATVAAAGRLSDIGLFIVPDPVMPIPPGRVKVRFVHLSPNAPNVDVTLPDGTILFEDVGYEEITDYLTVDPAAYTLEARLTGTDQMILYVPNINLTSNRFYTVYAVGLVGESPPLQVLIPLDGNSYIKP